MTPAEEFSSMTVDRIGSDIVVHCPSEESAEAGRNAIATLFPVLAVMFTMLENGGLGGLFGDL